MRLAHGFDKAFVGTTISAFGRKQVALYDYDKCILILMEKNKWSEEDAIEYFDFNVIGAWVGETTPIFINQHTIENIEDYRENNDD